MAENRFIGNVAALHILSISQLRYARPWVITKSFWLLKSILEATGWSSAWTWWDLAL